MSTSLTPALTCRVARSATVEITVPALKEPEPVTRLTELDRPFDDDAGHRRDNVDDLPRVVPHRDARGLDQTDCTAGGIERLLGLAERVSASRLASTETRPFSNSFRLAAYSRWRPRCRSSWPDPALRTDRSCAWFTSGSMRAMSWPFVDHVAGANRQVDHRPNRFDLISTLTSGSTVPTSRTTTWTSSMAAARFGISGPFSFIVAVATGFRSVGHRGHGNQHDRNGNPPVFLLAGHRSSLSLKNCYASHLELRSREEKCSPG